MKLFSMCLTLALILVLPACQRGEEKVETQMMSQKCATCVNQGKTCQECINDKQCSKHECSGK